MIKYHSVKHKHTSNESGSQDDKGRTISKQLEYATKGHIATQKYCFQFKTALLFSFFSSLVL